MVAWRMTLKTPEFPDGRDVIVIANDITHLIGSFGPKEDQLFLVSCYLHCFLEFPIDFSLIGVITIQRYSQRCRQRHSRLCLVQFVWNRKMCLRL